MKNALDYLYSMKKANEFGVWFWEDFYSIDAKRISKPVDFSKYTNIYEDFKGKK